MIKIPESVLKLLALEWRPTGGHSSFDSVFNDERGSYRRRADPSYYMHRPDNPDANNGLKHAEVVALVADGVLLDHRTVDGTHIRINEHEQHALNDFCSEVYDAWRKFQARIKLARDAHGSN
jgi:hypothetical protein